MTIDERLEKLTGRHEALAQSLEIVAGMQRENEKSIAQLTVLMGQSLQSINQLARIAEAH